MPLIFQGVAINCVRPKTSTAPFEVTGQDKISHWANIPDNATAGQPRWSTEFLNTYIAIANYVSTRHGPTTSWNGSEWSLLLKIYPHFLSLNLNNDCVGDWVYSSRFFMMGWLVWCASSTFILSSIFSCFETPSPLWEACLKCQWASENGLEYLECQRVWEACLECHSLGMLVEYQTNKQLWFCFSSSHGKHGWNASAWACEWNEMRNRCWMWPLPEDLSISKWQQLTGKIWAVSKDKRNDQSPSLIFAQLIFSSKMRTHFMWD